MPNVPRRRTRKLRPRKAKSTRAIAKRGFRLAKTLASTREVKYYTSAISGNTTTTGTITSLLDIAQGDSADTRDGNQITLRSIRFLGSLSNGDPSTLLTGNPSAIYRVILFQDKQQVSDTPPAVNDVLFSPDYASVYNYPNVVKRFKILYDRSFVINAPGIHDTGITPATAYITCQKSWSHWLFPTMKNIKYNGTLGSDLQKGGVYMLMLGTSTDPSFIINYQVAYNDS